MIVFKHEGLEDNVREFLFEMIDSMNTVEDDKELNNKFEKLKERFVEELAYKLLHDLELLVTFNEVEHYDDVIRKIFIQSRGVNSNSNTDVFDYSWLEIELKDIEINLDMCSYQYSSEYDEDDFRYDHSIFINFDLRVPIVDRYFDFVYNLYYVLSDVIRDKITDREMGEDRIHKYIRDFHVTLDQDDDNDNNFVVFRIELEFDPSILLVDDNNSSNIDNLAVDLIVDMVFYTIIKELVNKVVFINVELREGINKLVNRIENELKSE